MSGRKLEVGKKHTFAIDYARYLGLHAGVSETILDEINHQLFMPSKLVSYIMFTMSHKSHLTNAMPRNGTDL